MVLVALRRLVTRCLVLEKRADLLSTELTVTVDIDLVEYLNKRSVYACICRLGNDSSGGVKLIEL